ncbi:MAG TPA: aspartate 1-decarboxylase [Thermoanaerobaculia bacterium]
MIDGKIHRARVTQADFHYIGSITIDSTLLKASGILPYQRVQVVNINNVNRVETYVIEGPPDSGVICLNGAAALLFNLNDLVIIMAYAHVALEEAAKLRPPRVVFVDSENRIASTVSHGDIAWNAVPDQVPQPS